MTQDDTQIRFQDGAGYERMMGTWSRLAGDRFLDWLNASPGLRWLDVGCGNGAFTQLLVDRCKPKSVDGIDPSEAQVSYARQRPAGRLARFRLGDAQELPYADASFDAAVMALVIFFVPDPVKGVAEMARVVVPGGGLCAYAWDILDGGFPLDSIQSEMKAMGIPPSLPPSVEAAGLKNLQRLWAGAGLIDVHTTQIRVQRTYESFDEFWEVAMLGSSVGPKVKALGEERAAELRERVRQHVGAGDGSLTMHGRANAVKGRKPA